MTIVGELGGSEEALKAVVGGGTVGGLGITNEFERGVAVAIPEG